MENKRITPKEFSNKSQNDEILKKQLELREREIVLKEKEMELKMLQRDDDDSIEKEKMLLSREKFRYIKKLILFLLHSFLYSLQVFLWEQVRSQSQY